MNCKKFNLAWFMFFLIMLSLPSILVAETYKGKIAETGYGKFKLLKNDGVTLLIFTGRKETSYQPETFFPETGDSVQVDCFKRTGRNDNVQLVATLVKLIKKNPNLPKYDSPMMVKLMEVGRKNIEVMVISNSTSIRMDKNRKMEVIPDGWAPSAGDKALVYFEKVKSTFGAKPVFVINKIEKK